MNETFKRIWIPFVILFFSLSAFARERIPGTLKPAEAAFISSGNWVGNGGVIVFCPLFGWQGVPVYQYSLLDVMEYTLENFKIKYPDGDLPEKVSALIDRAGAFAPKRALLYKKLAAEFMDHVRFMESVTRTIDATQSIIPAGCRADNAINQMGTGDPKDVEYRVSSRFWNELDEDVKASLILHEIFYFEADLLGHRNNSHYVRRYVRNIIGDNYHDQANFDWMTTLMHLGVQYWMEPATQKEWTLFSIQDMTHANVENTCKFLGNGRLPTKEEFLRAQPLLFASAEAKSVFISKDPAAFQIGDVDREKAIWMDRKGKELPLSQVFENGIPRTILCIQDEAS